MFKFILEICKSLYAFRRYISLKHMNIVSHSHPVVNVYERNHFIHLTNRPSARETPMATKRARRDAHFIIRLGMGIRDAQFGSWFSPVWKSKVGKISEQKWLNRLQMVQFECPRHWNSCVSLRLGELHFPFFLGNKEIGLWGMKAKSWKNSRTKLA